MYTNFKDLHKAYGFDNPSKSREDLTEDEEIAFVNDCYETYEHIGFTDTFDTPYTDNKKYVGMKFIVVGRVKELSVDKDGVDLENLPMWNIQLENGDTIAAYPEEICLAERSR